MPDYDTGIAIDYAPVYDDPINKEHRHYLKPGDNVMIDYDRSDNNFYHVYTETSIEGYCRKKYIEVA